MVKRLTQVRVEAMRVCVIGAVVGLLQAGVFGAQVSTAVTNSGERIAFDRAGTLVGAVVFGHPGTYDGMPFVQWRPSDRSPLALGDGVCAVMDSSGYPVTDLGGGGPFQTEQYAGGDGPQTLTFTGLATNKTYAFQFSFRHLGAHHIIRLSELHHQILARFGKQHKLLRAASAHGAGIGFNDKIL